jgi:hypothetical protein
MRLAHTTLWLDEPPATRDRSFITNRGEPLACLDVGNGELSIFGSPDGLRRLAAALVVSADAAETLGQRAGHPAVAVYEAA